MSALSRWSGGLVARFGARRPLILGPVIAAGGFLLLMRPSVGDAYWTGWLPAILTLGLGMAISVAPLTTAVMGSVETRFAGVASGVNNAVSRVAGLLAVAALSLILTAAFSRNLDQRLAAQGLPSVAVRQISSQSSKLAATPIPALVPDTQKAFVQAAIARSYVTGFRLVMAIAALLAVMGAVCAALMIDEGLWTSASQSRGG